MKGRLLKDTYNAKYDHIPIVSVKLRFKKCGMFYWLLLNWFAFSTIGFVESQNGPSQYSLKSKLQTTEIPRKEIALR